MNKVISWNVARHALAQLGIVLLFAALDKLPGADWSWLGAYQGEAQILIGALVAAAHEFMGTAPKAV